MSDGDGALSFARPPWLHPSNPSRSPPTQQKEQPVPELPPQDCLVSHKRLRFFVHEIARRYGLSEIDKGVYNVIQTALVIRMRTVFEQTVRFAKHRRGEMEGPLALLRRVKTSDPGAVIQRQQEEGRRLEQELLEERDAVRFIQHAAGGRKRQRTEEFVAEMQAQRQQEDQQRQNETALLMLGHVSHQENRSKPLKPLSPETLRRSLAKIDRELEKTVARLAKIEWNHKRAAEKRRMEGRIEQLTDEARATLQDLRWRFEAYQVLDTKRRDLERQKEVLHARDPERIRAKEEERRRAAEAAAREHNVPLKRITMRDARACDLIGEHVFERYELRQAQRLAHRQKQQQAGRLKRRRIVK